MNHQVQEMDGTLNTYNTETFWVPILLTVDATIYTDSILDQLKATESVIKTFFKSKAYQVDVAYTRIPCLISFPDDYQNERTIEFSFTDKREFTTKFSLEIKSHIPIFKENTSIFAGNTMENFQANTYIPPVQFGPDGGNNTGPTIAGDLELNPDGTSPNSSGSGGDALYSNIGNPKATGATGSSISGSIPNTPSWPVTNKSALPPNGGAKPEES